MKQLLEYFLIDVEDGFQEVWKWYLLAAVLFALLCFSLDLRIESQGSSLVPSFGERLASVVAGGASAMFQQNAPYAPPVDWFALMLLSVYITLWYPFRSLAGFGEQVLVAGGSKSLWWTAKCLWIVSAVFLFWVIGLAVVLLSTAIDGGRLSFSVSAEFVGLYRIEGVPSQDIGSGFAMFIIAVPMVVCACSLVQACVSVLLHPNVGFVVSVALLFVSAYYASPFLLGDYAMALRSSCLIVGGMEPADGIGLSFILLLISFVFGSLMFARSDVVSRGDRS